jgi:2'-5' RNA ligase
MYAIASLLNPTAEQEIRSLWSRFEAHCGLTEINEMPLPHFSWLSADSCHFPPIEQSMQEAIQNFEPFMVRTAGLGIFTGPLPVVYIALVKDAVLLNYHQILWGKTLPFTIVPNAYYHPTRWVPHITLAYQVPNAEGLGCAIQDIAFQPIEMELQVDTVALLYHSLGQDGIRSRYHLNKEKANEKDS